MSWLPSLASPKLGTAQPQLVLLFLILSCNIWGSQVKIGVVKIDEFHSRINLVDIEHDSSLKKIGEDGRD